MMQTWVDAEKVVQLRVCAEMICSLNALTW